MKTLLALAALIALPLSEVAVFAWSGEQLGIWTTVGLVLLTAAIGVAMIRTQGLALLRRAQAAANRRESPQREIVEGAALALAGVCLLAPGFITDSIGFALLIPPLRGALAQRVVDLGRRRGPNRSVIIDVDYQDVSPPPPDPSELDRPRDAR
ncbi:MAG: FxsA family protein [Pseudomonadota bacterium]